MKTVRRYEGEIYKSKLNDSIYEYNGDVYAAPEDPTHEKCGCGAAPYYPCAEQAPEESKDVGESYLVPDGQNYDLAEVVCGYGDWEHFVDAGAEIEHIPTFFDHVRAHLAIDLLKVGVPSDKILENLDDDIVDVYDSFDDLASALTTEHTASGYLSALQCLRGYDLDDTDDGGLILTREQ